MITSISVFSMNEEGEVDVFQFTVNSLQLIVYNLFRDLER